MRAQLQHAVAGHQTTEQDINSLCLEARLEQEENATFLVLLLYFASELFVVQRQRFLVQSYGGKD